MFTYVRSILCWSAEQNRPPMLIVIRSCIYPSAPPPPPVCVWGWGVGVMGGGSGYGGGGRGRLYTYRYTVTTRMTSALRWAAVRDILMFQKEVMDKVTSQCPQTATFLKRKASRSGIDPRFYQPNALPLGKTGSRYYKLLWSSYGWTTHRERRLPPAGSVVQVVLMRLHTHGPHRLNAHIYYSLQMDEADIVTNEGGTGEDSHTGLFTDWTSSVMVMEKKTDEVKHSNVIRTSTSLSFSTADRFR